MTRQSQLHCMSMRIVTLLCAVLVAAVHYGMRVWLLSLVAVIGSMISEFSCVYLRGKPFRLWHLEAAADGLILTLLMPASVSYHTLIISCIGANIIGRHILGGEERPLIPTAAIGWCIALSGWQDAVTTYPALRKLPVFSCEAVALTENRTLLWQERLQFRGDLPEWLAYIDGLPMGSGSLLLLVVTGIVLAYHKAADHRVLLGILIPMLMLINSVNGGVTEVSTVFAAYSMCGSTLFSIIYLAADSRLSLWGIIGAIYGIVLMTGSLNPGQSLSQTVLLAALLAPPAVALSKKMECMGKETIVNGRER